MNEAKTEVFRNAPVPKAVLSNALPAMLAMLMVLVYNLADTFFIGQTGDALQVAAVSLATPVFLIFMTLGTVFGIGGTSLISRCLGAGRAEYARHICAFCFWGCLVTGAVLLVIMFAFMDPLLYAIGASNETFDFAKTYLAIISACGPLAVLGNCFSNILRAEGQSARGMAGMTIGNIVNFVLDPVLILGAGWGVAGCALATVIGNAIGAGYYLLYFLRGRSSLSIRLPDVRLSDGIFGGVMAIGIPAAIGDLMMSVSNIVVNAQMAAYGDMAVAGIGVAMKVTMMTGIMCIGLAQGVQPLLGYCTGAQMEDRYRKCLHFSLAFSLGLSTVLTLLCYAFTGPIVGAFLENPDAYSYAVEFSRILLSTSFLFGVFYVLLNALQAMGASTASLIVNLSRQGLIYLPALFILQSVLGVTGLVWAQPVADVLSLALEVVLYRRAFRKLWGGKKNAADRKMGRAHSTAAASRRLSR
ncbi:MAG: MATE family efflux transporter [Eggerthellaceae bacterium]|jgi:multidrug efflux pump